VTDKDRKDQSSTKGGAADKKHIVENKDVK
jgi:hypothetical protein